MTSKLTRPPLARMLRIHDSLTQGLRPNCTTLSRQIEVSVKTIQRDIEFMRDQLGLPIEYDERERGYFFSQAVTSFPALQISEGELMALLVAGRAMEQYRGTPYERILSTALHKLVSTLDSPISFSPDALSSGFSFGSLGQSETDMATFEILSRAVMRHQRISFQYKKPGSQFPEQRRVNPYHLAFRDNLCYLIGQDVDKGALRQFALLRMSAVKVLKETFVLPSDFSPEAYFRGAFGAQGGQGSFEVRLRFDASAAFYIKERRWHPSQTIKDLPKGELELALQLSTLEEVERWILSWGEHVVVLAPEDLAASIRERSRRVLENYR